MVKPEVSNVRVIKTGKGNVYIRKEDVAELIRDFVATEPTDTRERGYVLANSIESMDRS